MKDKQIIVCTSYFGNHRMIDKSVFDMIAISRVVPPGYKKLMRLRPGYEIYNNVKNGIISEERYKKQYISQISKIFNTSKEFVDYIKTVLEQGKIPVLMCFEKPPKTCHRHFLSDIFTDIKFIELPFQ